MHPLHGVTPTHPIIYHSGLDRLRTPSTKHSCNRKNKFLYPHKPRVLRDRLVPLLENAADAWGRHRQPWQKTPLAVGRREATESDVGHFQRRATVSTRQKHNPHRLRSGNSDETKLPSPRCGRLCCLDSGAGPRKFWETVAGPRLVEASWNVDIKVGCTGRQAPCNSMGRGVSRVSLIYSESTAKREQPLY